MVFIKRIKYKFKWADILLSIVNVGLLISGIKLICMILYRIYGVGSFLASFWGYDEKSGLYFAVNYLYDNGKGIKILWVIFIFTIVFILVMFLFLAKKNAKRKLLIIEHYSLQKMNFTYNKEELEDYADKHLSISQYETLKNESISTDKKVQLVITEIDNIIPEILKFIEKGYKVGYAGIANIPATFMLGYELGDENKKIYFHKRRDESSDDNFHLLKEESRQLTFSSEKVENDPKKSGKILLLIQLTQLIKESDLQGVKEENDYIIKYEIPKTIKYDIVDTSNQINKYTNKILQDINEIQKNPNITQIKICVAASSSFIFALGSKFSKTQNIDTVIFHYQNGIYPWGIDVTKKSSVVLSD